MVSEPETFFLGLLAGMRFARRLQEAGNVGIRKYQAARIDRSGERRILEPPPKPSSQLKPVEPQRRLHERLEKPLALRGVKSRPALHRRLGQISAPHVASLKAKFSKGKWKNEKRKYAEVAGSRGPRINSCPPKDPETMGVCTQKERPPALLQAAPVATKFRSAAK
jgi:hypothetical protein